MCSHEANRLKAFSEDEDELSSNTFAVFWLETFQMKLLAWEKSVKHIACHVASSF